MKDLHWSWSTRARRSVRSPMSLDPTRSCLDIGVQVGVGKMVMEVVVVVMVIEVVVGRMEVMVLMRNLCM